MNALTPYIGGSKDPTTLVWPPTMLIELALKTGSPDQIRIEYGYSLTDWEKLPTIPAFMRDLAQACELVRQEGMSFKLKAKLIAEENLGAAYKLVHDESDKAAPHAVKAKVMELVARWAGFDERWSGDGKGGPVNANTLQISINLGTEF